MSYTREDLANLIFPNTKLKIADIEKKYPLRKLPKDAMVTRFAPSPTGFLHTGSLFACLISWRLAVQSKGVFYCRLEDTDTKREIKGSGDVLLTELEKFGIIPNESFLKDGIYSPYVQSLRKEIYDAVIKELIIKDLAYPCFFTVSELDDLRKEQEKNKINPGYYGKYARDRFLSVDDAISKIKNNMEYVIRFKSPGKEENKVICHDLIRGDLELPENIQDIVIMKKDGLPTYHFAHLVDDHFMRTTHITRGEEWLSSLPIHLQLFDSVGFKRPEYAHLPVIMKTDNGQRRKLSKRKDPEAAVSYFLEKGYPAYPFLEYLLTIANSNFEEWRIKNHDKLIFDFELTFSKMSLDGALFDIEKVNYFSREYLGQLSAKDFVRECTEYAKEYSPSLFNFINKDKTYFEKIISIERGGIKPRKDYANFSEIIPLIGFMDDEIFLDSIKENQVYNEVKNNPENFNLIKEYIKNNNAHNLDESEWFENLKKIATKFGYALNKKEYKENPDKFKGMISDCARILRVAISGKESTPNFYHIQKIMGKERLTKRLKMIIGEKNE